MNYLRITEHIAFLEAENSLFFFCFFFFKQLLKEEIAVMKDKLEHHPDVTRFAMENLELRGN